VYHSDELSVSKGANTFLVIAGLLGAAAYLFAEDPADAATLDSGSGDTGAPVSNGFGINNPLNIRYLASNAFRGQIGNHNGYGQYDTLENGTRAAGLQLTAYYNRGLTTPTQIISTWAPSSENDTGSYISDVSGRMGVAASEPLAWPQDEVSLIQAMAFHENGYNNMSDDFVASAIAS
jgi:hypothetical protein